MDWATPDIEQFLSFENANELVFAVLMAHHRGMRVISSESQAKQVAALCRGKSDKYVTHAFIFYACRDLIRFRGNALGNKQSVQSVV